MSKKIFITGTGTDVGNTYVAGLIVKKLQESGVKAAYYKAAMSGNDRDADGKLIPGDAMFVKNMSNITQPVDTMCPYIYETAVSPHLAARLEGGPVEMSVVKAGFDSLTEEYDYIIKYSDGERSKVRCYGANDVREGVAIMHMEGVDVSITGNSTSLPSN